MNISSLGSCNVIRTITRNTIKQFTLNRSWRSISTGSPKYESFKVQSLEDFKERVLNSRVPVIVDFHAAWCNPCRQLTPRIESVVEGKKGKVLLATVDIDENTDLALHHDVASVPVLIGINNGKVISKLVGLQDKDVLSKFADTVIAQSERGKDESNK